MRIDLYISSEEVRVHVRLVGSGVSIRDLRDLLSRDLGDFLLTAVLSNSCKVGINHGIGISLSAFHCKATVEEPGAQEHLPNDGVAPIVGCHLGEDLDAEIVVTRL